MPDALIMTSGNAQDTPICMNDEEAARFLSPLCDTILSNDREIRLRADDSVMDWFDGEPYMVRRSRGYAPLPVMVTESRDWQTPEIAAGKNLRSNAEEAPEGIEEETPKSTAEEASGNAEEKTSKSAAEDVLKGAAVKDPGDIAEKVPKCTAVKAPGKVLGIGGELKNAFCLASEELYYLSPYIGNLTDVRGTDALESAVTRMEELLEIRPDRVVCDLHPGYMSSGTAKRIAAINGIPVEMVQHHHAHILSCMAENDCQEPVIGIAFDGTGYGSDGTVWGGEFLIADRSGFQRAGSIEPFTQTGGDLAPREGWRAAAALLMQGCHTKKMTADEPESGRTGAKLEEPEGRMIKGKTERPKTGMTGDKPDKPEAGMAEKMLIQLGVCTADELRLVRAMIQNGINAIPSSSAGRVFDAASAVLGLRRCSTSEGEASMVLQFAAEKYQKVIGNLPESLQEDSLAEYARRIPLVQTQCSSLPDGRAGNTACQAQSSSLLQIPAASQAQSSLLFQIPVSWLIRELAVRRQSRMPQKESGREDQLQQAESGRQGQIPQAEPGRQGQIPQAEPSLEICRLAYEFHEAMAVLITRGAERCRDLSGLNTVALSGGVMQNTLLLSRCIKHLEDAGFRVLRHHMVPPNDGGIALGQAYYRP